MWILYGHYSGKKNTTKKKTEEEEEEVVEGLGWAERWRLYLRTAEEEDEEEVACRKVPDRQSTYRP